jgi:hypothetical protein
MIKTEEDFNFNSFSNNLPLRQLFIWVVRIRIWDPMLFDPWILDSLEKNPDPGSGIRDKHPGSYFYNFVSVFWVNSFFMRIRIKDSGSFQPWIRDAGWKNRIRDKHPGSATLAYIKKCNRLDFDFTKLQKPFLPLLVLDELLVHTNYYGFLAGFVSKIKTEFYCKNQKWFFVVVIFVYFHNQFSQKIQKRLSRDYSRNKRKGKFSYLLSNFSAYGKALADILSRKVEKVEKGKKGKKV